MGFAWVGFLASHSTAWLEADLNPFRCWGVAAFGDTFERNEDIGFGEVGGEVSLGDVIGDNLPGV